MGRMATPCLHKFGYGLALERQEGDLCSHGSTPSVRWGLRPWCGLWGSDQHACHASVCFPAWLLTPLGAKGYVCCAVRMQTAYKGAASWHNHACCFSGCAAAVPLNCTGPRWPAGTVGGSRFGTFGGRMKAAHGLENTSLGSACCGHAALLLAHVWVVGCSFP